MPSGGSTGTLMRYCSQCGQCIVVPTADLTKSFRCPRCRTVHLAESFVDKETPLAAVPLTAALPVIQAVAIQTAPDSQVAADAATRAPQPAADPLLPPQVVSADPVGGAVAQSAIPHTPPAVDAEVDRARLRSKAIAQSAMAAAASASTLVDLADRIDSWMYGWRARVLVGSAAAVVLTHDVWTDAPDWVAPVSLAGFLLVALVLVLARVAMFRDDDGHWVPSRGWAEIGVALRDLPTAVRRFRQLKERQQVHAVGEFLIGASLVSLALRACLDWLYQAGFDSWEFEWSALGDGMVLVLGAYCVFEARRRTERAGRRAALIVEPAVDSSAADAVAAAVLLLPAVIDCAEPEQSAELLKQATHPLLAQLADCLAGWRPRRADSEKVYQLRLCQRLSDRSPETTPEREYPLRRLGVPYSGRIDIRLGACLLIEMKRRLTTSGAQKAVGQIRMYARLANGAFRMPIVLVVCDSEPDFVRAFLEPEIESLRREGQCVTAVLTA